MKLSSFAGYFFGAVFLTNAVPHLLVAVTGRRNLTPFGRDSSSFVNLLWSGINFCCGYLLVRFADGRAGVKRVDAKGWQIPYEAGCLFWSLFGVVYSWFTAREELREGTQDERE